MKHLTEVEARVLGALIEKAVTTPDYYPLTLNGLTTACNQKSNRDPVVGYDDETVVRGVDGLRERHLANMVTGAGRVPKYSHQFDRQLALSEAQLAVLCVLMLRGPQTPGEIKSRSGRLHEFAELGEVEAVLNELIGREGEPLAVKLPRQSGRKESRYAHLLCGEPVIDESEFATPLEPARLNVQQDNQRLDALEAEVADLRAEVAALRQQLETFLHEFE